MSMGHTVTADEVLAAQTSRVAAVHGRPPGYEDYADVYRRLGLPEQEVSAAAERSLSEAAARTRLQAS
jgi:hypothetical protein